MIVFTFLSTSLLFGLSAAVCEVKVFSSKMCSGTPAATFSTTDNDRWDVADKGIYSLKVSSDCYKVDFFEKTDIDVPPFWGLANWKRTGSGFTHCKNKMDIPTYAECIKAAEAYLGKSTTVSQQISQDNVQKGCTVRTWDDNVFFNTPKTPGTSGRYNVHHKSLCEVYSSDYFGGALKSQWVEGFLKDGVWKDAGYRGVPQPMNPNKCYILPPYLAGKVGFMTGYSVSGSTYYGRSVEVAAASGFNMTVVAVVIAVLLFVLALGSAVMKKNNVESADNIAPVIAI